MPTCKVCKTQIAAGERYCATCLNDPKPLRRNLAKRATMTSRKKIAVALAVVAVAGIPIVVSCYSSSAPEQQSASAVKLDRAKHLLDNGDAALALEDLRNIPSDAPEYKEAQSLIPIAVGQEQVSKATRRAADEKVKREAASVELSTPKPGVIELLGYSLSKQYENETLWIVRVSGDDSTKTLYFDCSDDPHPKDVCLMLYKLYPSQREASVLRRIGVRRLVFSAGVLTSYSKTL